MSLLLQFGSVGIAGLPSGVGTVKPQLLGIVRNQQPTLKGGGPDRQQGSGPR